MYVFMFKVMESGANERAKKAAALFFYLRPLFLFFPSSSAAYAPLLDPGVLNCDESRSLRGVDMLLASNAGSGDVSFPVELWRGSGAGERSGGVETNSR